MNATLGMGTLQEIVIRPANPSDWDLLWAMYKNFEPRPASLGLPPRKDDIAAWFERLNDALNLVAVVHGKVVGHAILGIEGSSGEVAVFVHQDYRLQGIERRLLDAVLEEARRLGLQSLWGMTELDNLPMLHLAHRGGFVRDATDPFRFCLNLRPSPKDPEGCIDGQGGKN